MLKQKSGKKQKNSPLLHDMRKNYELYLMVIPAVLLVMVFSYAPMYGIQLAFKDYSARAGIFGSKWVGLKHIRTFFESPYFFRLLWNTLSINIYSLLWGFWVPIVIALIINEITCNVYKKTIQTIICAPHFISTVVMVGMIFLFTNESRGFINNIISVFGFERIPFMAKEEWFRTVYIASGIWQGAGWSSIIYIAALSGVDTEMHEAAIIDGATRMQRIWHINIPAIKPTIIILLLMNMGSMLTVGFEKVFLMQLPLNLDVSEVISTYTYKIAFEGGSFSYSTAIGLFLNIINLILLTVFNKTANNLTGTSLW